MRETQSTQGEFEVEAAAFLQGRLRLVTAIVSLGVVAIMVPVRLADLIVNHWDPEHYHLDAYATWLQLGIVVLFGACHFALRKRSQNQPQK